MGEKHNILFSKEEIAKRIEEEELHITAIPTSYEMRALCHSLNIPTASILEKRPDWGFDGADEVDKNNNWIIKGRGAALFKEKLNMVNAGITYILVDDSKLVDELNKVMPIDSDKIKLLRVHPTSKVHFYSFVSSIQKRNFDHAIDHGIFQKKFLHIPFPLSQHYRSFLHAKNTSNPVF